VAEASYLPLDENVPGQKSSSSRVVDREEEFMKEAAVLEKKLKERVSEKRKGRRSSSRWAFWACEVGVVLKFLRYRACLDCR